MTFDIDANGILHVSAKDLATSKEQSIEIKSSSGLSEAEIQKMTREAKDHEEEDRKKREGVEAKNQADNLIYNTEKTLKEYGDKVSAGEKENIKAAIERLKKTIQGNDVSAIRAEMDALMSASHKLAQAMYEDAARKRGGGPSPEGPGAGPGPEAGPQGGAKKGQAGGKKGEGDDVIDADFEEEGVTV